MERYSEFCFMVFNLGQGTENTCCQCLIMLNTIFLRNEGLQGLQLICLSIYRNKSFCYNEHSRTWFSCFQYSTQKQYSIGYWNYCRVSYQFDIFFFCQRILVGMDIEITFCLPYILIGIIPAGILVLGRSEYEILDCWGLCLNFVYW